MANSLRIAIDNLVTSIKLDRSTDFPVSGFVQIDSEIIQYNYSSDLFLLECTRGVKGTSAASHLINATVTLVTPVVIPSVHLTGIVADVASAPILVPTEDGLYLISYYVTCTAGSGSGTGPTSMFSWTDASGFNQMYGQQVGSSATLIVYGSAPVFAKANQPISFYTQGGVYTDNVYEIDVVVTKL